MPSARLAVSFVTLASLLAVAAPIAAQCFRDVLVHGSTAEVKADRVSLIEHMDADTRHGARPPRGSGHWAGRDVRQPATEIYQYDDNDFERFVRVVDKATGRFPYEMEFAQRFRLPKAGTVEYAVACVARAQDDEDGEVYVLLRLYTDAGNVPETALLGGGSILVGWYPHDAGTYRCHKIEISDVLSQERRSLNAGHVWVGVTLFRGTPPTNTKLLAVDEDSSG